MRLSRKWRAMDKKEYDKTVDAVTAVVVSDIRTEMGAGPIYATRENVDRIRRIIANTAATMMNPPVDVDTFLSNFQIDICETSVANRARTGRIDAASLMAGSYATPRTSGCMRLTGAPNSSANPKETGLPC